MAASTSPKAACNCGFLGHVVEVVKINVRESRPIFSNRVQGRFDNPLSRFDIGERSPEVHQREMAERIPQFFVKLRRLGIAPEGLGSVRVVDRGRRADEIGGGPFDEQGKPGRGRQLRIVAAKCRPDLRSFDDLVPGRPHFDFAPVPPEETVGDDAVLFRADACRQGDLAGTRHARKRVRDPRREAPLAESG
jgi:hypothetical protein